MDTDVEIVAHRGVPGPAPENTIAAFERAIELGADGVELDVRLSRDHIPVVHHYFYVEEGTSDKRPIFELDLREIQAIKLGQQSRPEDNSHRIPTLLEVLEAVAGRIGLEIEIKGPEPESADRICAVLKKFRSYWPSIEVTSYEPFILHQVRQSCSGLKTDLLFPLSPTWMGNDVATYTAIQRARLAGARAVHLHPSQLSAETVEMARSDQINVHAWDVNDESSLGIALKSGVRRFDTDRFEEISSLLRDARKGGSPQAIGRS